MLNKQTRKKNRTFPPQIFYTIRLHYSLGLQHDGDEKAGNNCTDQAQEGSIMAPMIISTFNKFLWSDCSREEFKNNAQ